jgi:UDP-N-acetylenolpyruvoylglucosamine reductase
MATLLEKVMFAENTLAGELAARLSPGTVIRRDEPLARHTTLRVGGPADVFVEPVSEADLAVIITFCGARRSPFFILGRGSNLLVRDGGVRGVVISLSAPVFSRITIVGEQVHCGAGARLKAVSVEAKRQGLSGMEFLEGIPGSVGGALRMNAGAMGKWTFDAVASLRFMDHAGYVHERAARAVPVEYRACPLLRSHIALGAVFQGQPKPRAEIEQTMRSYSEKRWASQPAAPSAGCIFKNPERTPSGKLVDELGLKGTRVGGAVVSAEHGNFIINDGGATAADVLALIAELQARVLAERGLALHPEVEIIGED